MASILVIFLYRAIVHAYTLARAFVRPCEGRAEKRVRHGVVKRRLLREGGWLAGWLAGWQAGWLAGEGEGVCEGSVLS